jgi:hypothetical protein
MTHKMENLTIHIDKKSKAELKQVAKDLGIRYSNVLASRIICAWLDSYKQNSKIAALEDLMEVLHACWEQHDGPFDVSFDDVSGKLIVQPSNV